MKEKLKNFFNNLFSLHKSNAHVVLKIFGIKIRFKFFFINQLEDCCSISNLEYILEQKVRMPHPIGITIHPNVKIGKKCAIYQNVTIGCDEKEPLNVPEIGDNVVIYANAVVFGKIKIGNNVKIGAGSVVFKDVPDNSTVAGNPARIISKKAGV